MRMLTILATAAVACGGTAHVGHFRGKSLGGLSDTVISLAVDPRGNVWVGTDNGLACFHDGNWLSLWRGWQVSAATPAGPDAAYVGVVLLKTVVHTKAQMREARVYKVFVRHGRLQEVQLAEPMPGDFVEALHVDRKRTLWVGMRDRGVLVHDEVNDVFKPALSPSQLDGKPTSFAEGTDGTLYIGSFGGGVTAYKGGKVIATYTPKNSDLRGNGVVRSVAFHPTLGLFAATANKLPGAIVGDIEAQSQGTGVSQLVGGRWKTWAAGGGLKSNDVSRIAVAPNGGIWFLSLNAGVSVFRGGNWFHPPVASETTYAIGFHGETAWIGTSAGLSRVTGF